jgi:hypothetical protein
MGGLEHGESVTDYTNWSEWITAASTAITGVFAGIAAWAAWVAVAREKDLSLPIVAPGTAWVKSGVEESLYLSLKITNRLDETLVLEQISVVRPRKAKIALMTRDRDGNVSRSNSATRKLRLDDLKISSRGATFKMMNTVQSLDSTSVEFHVFLGPGFSGKAMRLRAAFSSNALTIRERRMTINVRVPPKKSKSSEEIINSDS